MALLPIVIYPDPRLEQVSAEVPVIDEEIRALIADMVETLYASDGVGLAAVQIGALKRIFVLDPTFAGGTKTDPALVFINPVIVATERKIKDSGKDAYGHWVTADRTESVQLAALIWITTEEIGRASCRERV